LSTPVLKWTLSIAGTASNSMHTAKPQDTTLTRFRHRALRVTTTGKHAYPVHHTSKPPLSLCHTYFLTYLGPKSIPLQPASRRFPNLWRFSSALNYAPKCNVLVSSSANLPPHTTHSLAIGNYLPLHTLCTSSSFFFLSLTTSDALDGVYGWTRISCPVKRGECFFCVVFGIREGVGGGRLGRSGRGEG
jgi:hypothetical protein